MATLNTSTNGPSISKSYQSIINAPIPGNSASPSYAQWAVFSVSTPLVNAFQQNGGGKESVLKVQSTSDGDLASLVDEFSDGRVQFAFAKIKDPNTTLPKYVLIAWCGEGVPERTKGYFTSHLAAVSKVLHGYHVQVTARSDHDLSPESIMQKVSDASGSKYSSGSPTVPKPGGPSLLTSSKPAFTPTQSSRGAGSFNSLANLQNPAGAKEPVDEDGWGQDAPPVTRTELEKVPSSYQPTKVNIHETSSQKLQPSMSSKPMPEADEGNSVVKGAYQPVGKVDIAALRRQAQESGKVIDDRPTAVRGSYEPVGKVDIAAIRAKAQQPSAPAPSLPGSISSPATRASVQSSNRGGQNSSAPAHTSERLMSLPKPKVGGKFGASANTFTGTKAPTPGGFGLESKPTPAATPVGVGRTFADQAGKTPAQLWAEKKARERGTSGASDHLPPASFGPPSSPIASQTSGGGDWKSGYKGKSWAPVQTTRTGQSTSSASEKAATEEDQSHEAVPSSPAGGVGAIRNRFKDASLMGVAPEAMDHSAPAPPPLDTSNKPNASRGVPIPGLPTQQSKREQEENRMPTPPAQPPRSPTPPTPPAIDSGSPIRVAMPVSRGQDPKHEMNDAREEQFSPPPAMPTRSLVQQIPQDKELAEEPSGHDPARAAGVAAAAASFGQQVADTSHLGVPESGKRALVQFDYEKAEDNELELREGEYVTNIEMVDEDWWMGQNPRGETGLFPSNYVELAEDASHDTVSGSTHHLASEPDEEPIKHTENTAAEPGRTATALYDYEAAEDNELSFPEHAKITGIEFPDDDWWAGEYQGRQGLFPANYVQLDQ